MSALSNYIKSILNQDIEEYKSVNEKFECVEDFSSLVKQLGLLKDSTLTPASKAYFSELIFSIAEWEGLSDLIPDFFRPVGIDIPEEEAARMLEYTDHTHPAFNYPKQNILRAYFSLAGCAFFEQQEVSYLFEISPADVQEHPGLLNRYIEEKDNEILQNWKKKYSKKDMTFAEKLSIHQQLPSIKALSEGAEIIFDKEDPHIELVAAHGMINCHGYFIFSKQSSLVYVAHISPQQSSGVHVFFGTPVDAFKIIPAFLEQLNKDDELTIIVCDKRGHSHISLPKLQSKIKDYGFAYEVKRVSQEDLNGFQETDAERYSFAYALNPGSFLAVHGEDMYVIEHFDAPELSHGHLTQDPKI